MQIFQANLFTGFAVTAMLWGFLKGRKSALIKDFGIHYLKTLANNLLINSL
jgi:hypothetical protein